MAGISDFPTHKPITLLLTRLGEFFVVTSITNSTWYKPGDHITFETAQKCCEMPGWTVVMADNHIVATILGGVSSAVSAGLGADVLGRI
jgi:hypothetical protein